MRTTKLIIGIFSIVLSIFITFQSLVAGLGNALMDNGEVSGTAGILVSILMLVGGIVVLVTQSRISIAPIIIFTISGILGLLLAGSYSDLYIWSSLNLIFAIILLFLNKKPKTTRRRVVKDENDEEVTIESRPQQKYRNSNNNWVFIVIAIIVVGFADLFFDFSGLGILDEISRDSETTEIASSDVEAVEESAEIEAANIIETDNFVIEILNVWLETNTFTNDEIIVFEYNITNKREEPTGNDTDWLLTMSAVQDNNDDIVNTLSYSSPKDYGIENYAQVKPGGTTTYGQGYILTDMETPVTLTAQEFLGGILWEKKIDITDLDGAEISEDRLDEDNETDDIIAMDANIKRSKGKFINLPKIAKTTDESKLSEEVSLVKTDNPVNSVSTGGRNIIFVGDDGMQYYEENGVLQGYYPPYDASVPAYIDENGGYFVSGEHNPAYEEERSQLIEEEYWNSQEDTTGYENYYTGDDGYIYENPIYENRYGPEDSEYESYE